MKINHINILPYFLKISLSTKTLFNLESLILNSYLSGSFWFILTKSNEILPLKLHFLIINLGNVAFLALVGYQGLPICEIGALDLAISTVIDTYRDSKKWLDFGISTEDGGHYLNEGLISQKEGFGGRTNIYQTWKLNI